MTGLVDDVLTRLQHGFTAAADPAKAPAMSAYMRDRFAFFGVRAPQVKSIARAAMDGRRPSPGELEQLADACFGRPEREWQYAACGYVRQFAAACPPSFLDVVGRLVRTKSWWDTVDTLAPYGAGALVRAHAGLADAMDAWIEDEDFWIARTALLHQLRFGPDTDAERLFSYCEMRAADTEFFVRKAIGWALRTYARTDPDAVRAFVDRNAGSLSGLSRREALKHIGPA